MKLQSRELPPRDDEGLLRHILGIDRGPEDPVGDPVDGTDVHAVERAERTLVARRGARHQVLIFGSCVFFGWLGHPAPFGVSHQRSVKRCPIVSDSHEVRLRLRYH